MEKEERKDREENSKVNLVILRTFRGVPVKKTPCRWGEKWGDGREEQKVRRSGWDSGELEEMPLSSNAEPSSKSNRK